MGVSNRQGPLCAFGGGPYLKGLSSGKREHDDNDGGGGGGCSYARLKPQQTNQLQNGGHLKSWHKTLYPKP